MNAEVSTTLRRHHHNAPRRLFRLTALVAGIALMAAEAHAADSRSSTEIQAEIEKLKQQLESDQKELATTTGASEPQASEQQAAAPENNTAELGQVEIRAARSPIATLKDVPQSTSVVSGKELAQLNAVTIGDITQRAGNVAWNLGNSRTSSISIRGIGKQAQTDAMDPSVGVIVDGVAYAYNPLSSFEFTDLADVEVARGPQGTQGAKNANLGFLDIHTRKPSFTPEQDYSITLGQFHTVLGRAAVGGPVIDDLVAWRGTLSVSKGEGAIKNVYNSDYSYPNQDNVSGRLQFLITPTDNFNALVRVDYEPLHSAYYNGWLIYTPTPTKYADGTTNPLTTDASTRLARRWFTQEGNYSYLSNYLGSSPNLDNQMPLVTASKGASAELNWHVAGATVTSISAYKDYYFQARNDEGTPFDISKNGGGHVFYHQLSEELRLTAHAGHFVDYQTGIYLLNTSNNYDSGSGYGADAGAWFANPTQYGALDADANGRLLLTNSLNRLQFKPLQQIRNFSVAYYGQADWHLADPLTLTTGVRITREERENSVSKLISDNGFAPELNPSAVNGVQLGGFDSDSKGALKSGNSAAQLALADATAQKYFGVTSYGALSGTQQQQVAYAKAIRQSQLGVLWNQVEGQDYTKAQPSFLVSPSYRINPDITAYLSWRFGEKAAISQVVNGVPFQAAPETSSAYELGLKSTLFERKLVFNADVFLDTIRNYQQAVQVFDQYTTNLNNTTTPPGTSGYQAYYTAATGNAAKVHVQGLEIDTVYTPFRSLSLRLAGAYNNAVYKDFQNSGQPLENGNLKTPYRDVSGSALPGAAKFTFNVGADYRHEVFTRGLAHASFNYNWTSRYNSDPVLSSYGWVPSYGIADLALGLGRRDERFDVSVLVKNLFNDQTSQVVLWNSYVPAVPRWVGVQFSAKL